MKQLSPQQKDRFLAINKRLGLADNAHITQGALIKDVQSKKKNLIFSSDPLESHVPPIYVTTGSIAEFKSKVDFNDDKNDPYVIYPAPLTAEEKKIFEEATSKADLLGKMDEAYVKKVKDAAYAYTIGDPAKVKEYEPVINAVLFPGKIAVFTGEPLDIPAGETYSISGPDPVVLNFTEITEGTGSEILVTTQATISTQFFTQQ